MDRDKETFETWNKIANLYQDKFMDLNLYNDSYDFICDALPKMSAKILDIGCGPGNITKYLLAKRPDFDIYGIDIAPNMITLAKKNNPTAHFGVMDCRQISTLKTSYDGIVCGFCLPYLSHIDGAKFIADCCQLLNVDGTIYISFVAGDPAMSDFQTSSTGDRSYFYFYETDVLTSQLKAHQCDDTTVIQVEYQRSETQKEIHTILTAKKMRMSHDEV